MFTIGQRRILLEAEGMELIWTRLSGGVPVIVAALIRSTCHLGAQLIVVESGVIMRLMIIASFDFEHLLR